MHTFLRHENIVRSTGFDGFDLTSALARCAHKVELFTILKILRSGVVFPLKCFRKEWITPALRLVPSVYILNVPLKILL